MSSMVMQFGSCQWSRINGESANLAIGHVDCHQQFQTRTLPAHSLSPAVPTNACMSCLWSN